MLTQDGAQKLVHSHLVEDHDDRYSAMNAKGIPGRW